MAYIFENLEVTTLYYFSVTTQKYKKKEKKKKGKKRRQLIFPGDPFYVIGGLCIISLQCHTTPQISDDNFPTLQMKEL